MVAIAFSLSLTKVAYGSDSPIERRVVHRLSASDCRRLVPGGGNRQLDPDLRTKSSGIGTEEECQ